MDPQQVNSQPYGRMYLSILNHISRPRMGKWFVPGSRHYSWDKVNMLSRIKSVCMVWIKCVCMVWSIR